MDKKTDVTEKFNEAKKIVSKIAKIQIKSMAGKDLKTREDVLDVASKSILEYFETLELEQIASAFVVNEMISAMVITKKFYSDKLDLYTGDKIVH